MFIQRIFLYGLSHEKNPLCIYEIYDSSRGDTIWLYLRSYLCSCGEYGYLPSNL